MIEELQRAVIWTMVGLSATAMSSLIITAFWLWIDMRSAKKSLRSVFVKVRKLEEKVYGRVTSELDGRE